MLTTADAENRNAAPDSHSVGKAFVIAMALPLGLVCAAASVRAVWPRVLAFDMTLPLAGLAGYTGGSWILRRAVRQAQARWVLPFVLYHAAVPIATVMLVVLLELARNRP